MKDARRCRLLIGEDASIVQIVFILVPFCVFGGGAVLLATDDGSITFLSVATLWWMLDASYRWLLAPRVSVEPAGVVIRPPFSPARCVAYSRILDVSHRCPDRERSEYRVTLRLVGGERLELDTRSGPYTEKGDLEEPISPDRDRIGLALAAAIEAAGVVRRDR